MGIKFFKKNRIDKDNINVVITVTDYVAIDNGQNYINQVRNRDNTNGWGTLGSNDSANTTMTAEMIDEWTLDHIILVKHNFKSYTIKYWNGSSFVDFSTPINETTNTEETTFHIFDKVSTSRLQVIINGCMIADDDKLLAQLIVTELIGEFAVQPKIEPVINKNRKSTRYLSGKSHIVKSVESFDVSIESDNVLSDSDLALQEKLFDSFEGFLVWPCGGDTAQYDTLRISYRLEDIFLMNCENEYRPAWSEGRYNHGMPINLKLVGVV